MGPFLPPDHVTQCADAPNLTIYTVETWENPFIFIAACYSFSALTLLVGRQEGHPACKNFKTEWWDVGVVVWDGVQTCI